MVIFLLLVVVVVFFVLSSRISRLEKMIEGKYVAPPAPAIAPADPATFMQAPVVTPKQEDGNLEFNMGGKVFTIIGALAVVLGVGFFLRYAFAQNLITEPMRVVLGIMGGILLLVLGQVLRARYQAYAHILSGGGLALLYLATYAAYNFYQLASYTVAFGGLAVITALGVALALAYSSPSLMALAQAGGFLTPLLLTNGTDHPHNLFVYIAVLNLAILWIATQKPWSWLVLGNLAGTAIVFLSWFSLSYTPPQFDLLFFYATLFFLIFLATTLVSHFVHNFANRVLDGVIAFATPLLYFAAVFFELEILHPNLDVLFTATLGILYVVLALLLSDTLRNIMMMLAFLFFFIAAPLQWDDSTVAIAWLVLGLVGALASLVTRNFPLRVMTYITFLVSGMSIMWFLEPDFRIALSLLFAVVLSLVLWAMHRFSESVTEQERGVMHPVLFIAIHAMLVWMISMEVLDYFDGRDLRRVMLSVSWIIYAALLLAGGIVAKSSSARMVSLVLFGMAILKVFLYDTLSLNDFFRFVSFITLGIILLAAGYLYYRYKDRIQQFIKGQ